MNQTEINDALMNALHNLYETNEMLHDYWMSELWDENDNPIGENWTEETVRLMENDVTREYVCEQLGIADCPENDDEINDYLAIAIIG